MRVVLPYVVRFLEAWSKILRNVGILVCSKPHLTLKGILPKEKRLGRKVIYTWCSLPDSLSGLHWYLHWGNWTGLQNKNA